MDIVLGVSMTPTTVRMVLVEGEKGDGLTVDHDAFDGAWGEIGVVDDFRRRGIGGELYRLISLHAAAMGKVALHVPASDAAVAAPMPLLAPVMSATRPSTVLTCCSRVGSDPNVAWRAARRATDCARRSRPA